MRFQITWDLLPFHQLTVGLSHTSHHNHRPNIWAIRLYKCLHCKRHVQNSCYQNSISNGSKFGFYRFPISMNEFSRIHRSECERFQCGTGFRDFLWTGLMRYGRIVSCLLYLNEWIWKKRKKSCQGCLRSSNSLVRCGLPSQRELSTATLAVGMESRICLKRLYGAPYMGSLLHRPIWERRRVFSCSLSVRRNVQSLWNTIRKWDINLKLSRLTFLPPSDEREKN